MLKTGARSSCRSVLACAVLVCGAFVLRAGESSKPAVREVIVVFKTHFDIGYTEMASNVVRRYRTTMIDDALRVVELNRKLPREQQFVWTLPGWPLYKIMQDWPGQVPARQERIRQAFKEGRFVVHALPFTTHTELLEPEELVRGLGFASQLSRGSGLSLPRDAKMTDVPCHSWILPMLLHHAGVDFLHLGCNAASSSPRVPRLFWWEGPDGSRLLTMYTAESYGTGLVPPSDWPHETWLALIHTGDNHGPPTPEEVKKLLDEAARKLPGVKVRIGRLSDFSDAILAEESHIPVVRGDMPDTWIHGPMSDPQGERLKRDVGPALATAESLGTLLNVWGVEPDNAKPALARAYEHSLLYGEHTWGGALYWVTKYGSGTKWGYGQTWKADHVAGRFGKLEDSWAEHTAYIETAHDLVRPLVDLEMRALARSVGVRGRRLAVFNPLPWTRTDLVTIDDPSGDLEVHPYGGKLPLPTTVKDGRRLFVAKSVPSMGYCTYELSQRSSPQTTATPIGGRADRLESPFFKLVLDPGRGCISSLVDKRSGRELVDSTSPHGFGQYLYERFSSNQIAAYVKAYVKIDADWAINELGKPSLPSAEQAPYRAITPQDSTLDVERNDVCAIATMRNQTNKEFPHGIITRVWLYRSQPFLDIEVTVSNKAPDPWPEAGWICLPFKVDAPRYRVGRQASIIDPLTDIVTGANRHLMVLNTGLAIFNSEGGGVGVCPIDSPLVSLGEPGCWKYSLDYLPKRPSVYINLFNNQWTTNFRLWNQGTWSSRVRVWAFDNFRAEAALIRPSLEARYPLQGCVAGGVTGSLPASRYGLELSRKGVLVTAFGPNPDGAGTVLRLWELSGESGRCRVRLPEGFRASAAQPVNLRGQIAGKPLTVRQGQFEAELRAFAPASFIFQN